MSMPTPGSLMALMTAILAMYDDVNTEIAAYNVANSTEFQQMRIYRWRPARIEPPAIYNWMPAQALYEQRDLNRWRDTVVITARIASRMIDVEDDIPDLEFYADAFRFVVDAELDQHQPLGVCQWAKRQSMRFTTDRFNDIEYLVFESPIEFTLDRPVH